MCMHGGHPGYWYQSVTKANANGDHGGAAICMDQGMDCNWVKVIYAATMATA